MSVDILPSIAAVFVLMMARLGTMVMLLPAIGEQFIASRFRLGLALWLVLVLFPLARPYYPETVTDMTVAIRLLVSELMVGFMLGVTGRLLLSSLQTAGSVMAQQLGLGFVMQVDPTQGQQGALMGNFLVLTGTALLFATDLHHLSIRALGDSYLFFQPGELPDAGDAAHYAVVVAAGAFAVGIQIAAPLLLFGFVFNVGLGVLARLMPQMQVFFIAVPASMMLGYALLAVSMVSIMTVFADHVRDGLIQLVAR